MVIPGDDNPSNYNLGADDGPGIDAHDADGRDTDNLSADDAGAGGPGATERRVKSWNHEGDGRAW